MHHSTSKFMMVTFPATVLAILSVTITLQDGYELTTLNPLDSRVSGLIVRVIVAATLAVPSVIAAIKSAR